jgi:hypothetical protein
MTFEEIMDHTRGMLQRRGRVSYHALKRQFDLDDAYLDDLKTEIIEVLRLAADQGNTMLVWTGSADTPPAPPLPASPGAPQPAPQAESATAPISHRTLDAERRQLTVMFCDLVDSTSLSIQLDPADLWQIVRAYQTTCADVIQHFGGHIAQSRGDGLLVYCGYPQAHEDDAQRAVRARPGKPQGQRQDGGIGWPSWRTRMARASSPQGAGPAGRGSGVRAHHWGTLLRTRAVSPPRGVAAGALCRATSRDRSVLAAGPRRHPPSAGQVAGATGRHEPGPSVAATGQACRGARATGPSLRLVHRTLEKIRCGQPVVAFELL